MAIHLELPRFAAAAREALNLEDPGLIRDAAKSMTDAYNRDVEKHGKATVESHPEFAAASRLHTELNDAASRLVKRVVVGHR
jgi:hypothetical protein